MRSAHCNFRGGSDNRSGGKSFSLALSWIDLCLLDNRSLITRTHNGSFDLRANTASGIGAQVFDLADLEAVPSLLLPFHIVQDYSRDLIELLGCAALTYLSLHERVLLDEE